MNIDVVWGVGWSVEAGGVGRCAVRGGGWCEEEDVWGGESVGRGMCGRRILGGVRRG